MNNIKTTRKTNYRWIICAMLFFATTVNYLDRQALSLTWKDFIAPEFHWTNTDYGNIAAAFSIMYAVANFFSGRIIDWLGTRRGYLWAIGVWSAGACLHALCGWATEQWVGLDDAAQMVGAAGDVAATVSMVSVWFFLAARVVLAAGESGNFPAAVKVTAEYFPKKDRAYATAIFNAGATVGALIAPLSIPTLARYFKDLGVGNGWEMAFVLIGMLGFIWMGIWVFVYKPMRTNSRVNQAERDYILQDGQDDDDEKESGKKLSILDCLKLRQTWAILFGKFLTDGVWWFFLFWTPAYISDVYGYTSDTPMAQMLMFVLYAITMLSLYGGKLPAILVGRTGGNVYACRMKAMFIFALFPLLGLVAQTLGTISCWLTICIIGIVGAAHQSWSANLFSVGSDLFPKKAVATITGINGMAGGVSSFLINMLSGRLLDYVEAQHTVFFGFEGKEAGYFMIFCYCSVAYIVGWTVMKILVPRYMPVKA